MAHQRTNSRVNTEPSTKAQRPARKVSQSSLVATLRTQIDPESARSVRSDAPFPPDTHSTDIPDQSGSNVTASVDQRIQPQPRHRMSVEYRNGRRIAPVPSSSPAFVLGAVPANKKGSRPTTDDQLTPSKKVRFNVPINERDESSREILTLLREIRACPRTLNLGQIGACFRGIQRQSTKIADTYFNHESLHCVPLADLRTKYPGLLKIIRALLDCSVDGVGVPAGWEKFLNDPQYRAFLVTAIIGEWMTERVFKHPAFGLMDSDSERLLQEIDRTYVQFDGFVRAKKRAALLTKILANRHNEIEHQTFLTAQSNSLARELLHLLDPLLPRDEDGRISGMRLSKLATSLRDFVASCGALHLSILLSGHNGTIVRSVPRVQPGHTFSRLAPFVAMNQKQLDKVSQSMTSHTTPLIRMTAWPRIEAYIPHGKDCLELAEEETKIRGVLASEGRDDFCWDCDAPSTFPCLPTTLHYGAAEKIAREQAVSDYIDMQERLKAQEAQARVKQQHDIARRASLELGTTIIAASSPKLPQDGIDDTSEEVRAPSPDTAPDYRGAYVSYYPCLAPHLVYAEYPIIAPSQNNSLTHTQRTEQARLRDESTLDAAISRACSEATTARSLLTLLSKHTGVLEYGTLLAIATLWWTGRIEPGMAVAHTVQFIYDARYRVEGLAQGLARSIVDVQRYGVSTLMKAMGGEVRDVMESGLSIVQSYLRRVVGVSSRGDDSLVLDLTDLQHILKQ